MSAERAEALRGVIEKVEADKPPQINAPWPDGVVVMDFLKALFGSLDAVARMEEPLRERGWRGPWLKPPNSMHPGWRASFIIADGHLRDVGEEAPTEARARLLAVLRALLFEEENHAS